MIPIFVLLALLSKQVSGHATYLLSGTPCTDSTAGTLAVGKNFMGSNAQKDTSRVVQVFRNGAAVTTGSNYVGGEVLSVTVSGFTTSLNFEVVLQAQGILSYKLSHDS